MNTVKVSIQSKAIYRFDIIPIKIPMAYFKQLESIILGPSSQGYGFSSGHVWMWELDYKESWALKNWCFWTVVLEKTLESPLDCREISSVNSKGNQSWIFIGRTDDEAGTPILWPPDAKTWLIEKVSLSVNWMGICTLAFFTPQMIIALTTRLSPYLSQHILGQKEPSSLYPY